jgi:hypothetical protein
MNNSTCPYCRKSNCALNLARLKQAGTLTLESPTSLSPDQLQLAGQLEELFNESTARPSWRDMVAPYEPALALESAPVDTSWMVTEEPRETIGGLFEPATDHWFSLESQESRFAGGLVRPGAGLPSAQEEQLRQLFLSKPAPKQASRKRSLEQLQALGWLSEQNDTLEVSPDRISKGGLIIPE